MGLRTVRLDDDPPTSKTRTSRSRQFQGEEYLSGYYLHELITCLS